MIINWLEKNKVIPLVMVLQIAVFIFYVSSLTFESTQKTLGIESIVYHIGVFFAFAFFLNISLCRGNKHFLIVCLLIALGYGVLDEIHQIFVPGRSASVFDVFLDFIGIVYASMIYFIALIRR